MILLFEEDVYTHSYKRIYKFIDKGIINNDEFISDSDKFIYHKYILKYIYILLIKSTCILFKSYNIITLLDCTFIFFALFGLICFSFIILIFFSFYMYIIIIYY